MEIAASLTLPPPMVANPSPGRGIGWAIRKVRKAQKRTLESVAIGAGTDAGNLSRIERGHQNAPDSLLRAIASELGLPMSNLWKLAEDGPGARVDITAKAGKMTADQLKELARFADYLLSQEPKH